MTEAAPQTQQDPFEELSGYLTLAEQAAERGKEDANLTAFLTDIAENVEKEDIYSGGHTIPGTDEHIYDTVTPRYTFATTDEKGKRTVQTIDPELGKRLLDYRAVHSTPTSEETSKPKPGELGKEADRLLTLLQGGNAVPKQSTRGSKNRSHETEGKATPVSLTKSGSAAATSAKEVPHTKTAAKARVSNRRDGIADLVKLDGTGRAHYEGGVKVVDGQAAGKLNGKFMTKHELDLIEEHQDLIRGGVKQREDTLKKREQYKARMLGKYGAAEYAERFADNPNVDPDAWLQAQQSAAPTSHEAKHRTDEAMPSDVTPEFWDSLSPDQKQIWGYLETDEEKQNLRNHVAAKAASAGSTSKEVELYRGPRLEVYEPVTDPSPKGLKARMNHIWNKAVVSLRTLKDDAFEKMGNFYGDEEKGKRRKVASVVAGVLAVGGVVTIAVLESRGHSTGHTGASANRTGGNGHGAGTVHGHGHGAGVHKPHATSGFQNVNLKPGTGDSLWHEEAIHHPHATQREIWERVQRDMAANHLKSEVEAENISGVFKITK